MAFDSKGLDDYIDVAQRIADFRERYPEGSLQPVDPANPWEQAIVTGVDKAGKQFTATMVVYKAAAYRTPDDARPGIGVAWEVFPGRTPYTAGSELQNAETSAWGRAIIAVGASDAKRGIASREEVRNRRAEREDGLPVNRDGSLSRSRTTDDEKDAAGVMTSDQHAEHTALRKGADGKLPNDEAAKVQNATATPPDDPFYDAPPTDLMPPEQRPGTASAGQLRDMGIAFTNAGVKERDARLKRVREITGRDVKSSKDLSLLEARAVLDALKVTA